MRQRMERLCASLRRRPHQLDAFCEWLLEHKPHVAPKGPDQQLLAEHEAIKKLHDTMK